MGLNEDNGLQMAFLDGNQPDRLCEPMKKSIEARGGEVRLNAPLQEIVTDADGAIEGLRLRDGSLITADEYVSAVPVDIFKRLMPKAWQKMPFFRQCDELEGIPVINLHMWFDRKLKGVDHLCFSRSPLLSVYADMSTTCKEYADEERSMLELVFAPCSPLAGGKTNWVGKTPRSVYAAIPGRNKYRPSQETPIPRFTLAGDWTSQKFLGSMEGAVLAGKLAAEVVSDRASGNPTKGLKVVQPDVLAAAEAYEPKVPPGVKGQGAIAFGGGAVLSKAGMDYLREVDAAHFEEQSEPVAASSVSREMAGSAA